MVPSRVHVPTNTSSFFNSGPGFGGAICASDAPVNINAAAKIIPVLFMRVSLEVILLRLSSLRAHHPTPKGPEAHRYSACFSPRGKLSIALVRGCGPRPGVVAAGPHI